MTELATPASNKVHMVVMFIIVHGLCETKPLTENINYRQESLCLLKELLVML